MVEILKDTDQRLVMTLGTRHRRWTKFILDKESGRAWAERHRPFWLTRTTEIALSDIASIDGGTPPGPWRRPAIVITLKSGKRHRFAGDSSVADAIARMRAFVGSGDTQSQSATPLWRGRPGRIAAALVAVALLAAGTMKLVDLFVLPACDSQRTRDTLIDLLQSKSKNPIAVRDFALVSRDKSEMRCQARIAVDGDTATVGYRSYWNGWQPMVRVTGAIGTAQLAPSRLLAVDEAYETFMTLARDAYQSGNPPRQSDPAVNALLTTIFDVAALPAKTLAGSEIDDAIRWFNSGDTVGSVYVLAGTGVSDFANLPSAETVQRRLRTNVVTFADEYGRYADFQVTLLAAIAEAQASYLASGPTATVDSEAFKSKVADIKPLLAQALKSDFIALVYDGLSDRWRMARLTTLARVAAIAAKVLSREDAAAVRDQALQTLPYFKDEAVKARVAEVADMIARR